MRWRRFKAKIAYRREKKKQKPPAPEFAGFCVFSLTLLATYCFVLPSNAGVLGPPIARSLSRGFGQATYVLLFLFGYRGLRLILRKEERRPWRYLLVDALIISAVCALFSSYGILFLSTPSQVFNPAGYLGKALATVLTQLLGTWGALFLSFFAVVGLVLWRVGRKPGDVLSWGWQHLSADWHEWREAVARAKQTRPEPTAKKPLPKVAPTANGLTNGKTARPELAEKPVVRMAPEAPKPPTVYTPPMPKAPVKKTEPIMQAATVMASGDIPPPPPFKLPSHDLLTAADRNRVVTKEEDLLTSAQLLEKTLADFGVQGKVVEIHPGPIITRFDYAPAPGTKVQAVANLGNDIALAMKAMSVRIVAPIPGKAAVGIELPNPQRAIVRFREAVESPDFENPSFKLPIALGKDAEGHPVVADLAGMPHVLIAGSTGAGKSVCIHALIQSLMFRSTPSQVKMLMIDPKRLELPLYNGIPYLYDPNQNPDNVRVITDSKEAAKALEGMIKVMDHRFKKFAAAMARDIGHYNEKAAAEGLPPEYYIVIIIDELADLMAVAAKEVETSIQRLTQMARAVGIHMVLATQRPSVDVITGVIKANLPARIAFRVASQTDSRVILDSSGAESLLGQGDMLFLPPGAPKPTRLQCGLVTAREVQVVSDFVKNQGSPTYERVMTPTAGPAQGNGEHGSAEELDDLTQALMLVLERKRVSQDLLKAHFGSSARATDLLSILEVKGFIAKPEGTNRWTIYYDRIDSYLGTMRTQASQNP